jgi:hypothetical protein
MWTRLLVLVGLLGVVGSMVNAERPTSQTATVVEITGAPGQSFDDPYPPPTPRP